MPITLLKKELRYQVADMFLLDIQKLMPAILKIYGWLKQIYPVILSGQKFTVELNVIFQALLIEHPMADLLLAEVLNPMVPVILMPG